MYRDSRPIILVKGISVKHRVNIATSDLHAVDARYHRACLESFYINPPSSSSSANQCSSDGTFERLKSHTDFQKKTCNCIEAFHNLHIFRRMQTDENDTIVNVWIDSFKLDL